MNSDLKRIVRAALAEDAAFRDVTSRALFAGRDPKITAAVVAKEAGVLCGLDAAETAFRLLDPRCALRRRAKDGDSVRPGQRVLEVSGRASRILAAERTALNFLQHLSGVATLTAAYVAEARGTSAKILDTRKTVPGLRALQKYAVRCGGGLNHRMDLAAMAMVKDNHLRVAERDQAWLLGLKRRLPRGVKLEIEAENLKQVDLALDCGADIILLDNMSLAQIRQAVKRIRQRSRFHRPLIEISGGVTLRTARAFAKTGVDRISVGRLTHSAPALDLSLEFWGHHT